MSQRQQTYNKPPWVPFQELCSPSYPTLLSCSASACPHPASIMGLFPALATSVVPKPAPSHLPRTPDSSPNNPSHHHPSTVQPPNTKCYVPVPDLGGHCQQEKVTGIFNVKKTYLIFGKNRVIRAEIFLLSHTHMHTQVHKHPDNTGNHILSQ